jgi:DNA-binding NarL/FixJ family response regulator
MATRLIRILLVDIPRLIGDMIEDAAVGDPRLEVVGRLSDPGDLVRAVDRADAGVVVTRAANEEGADVARLLRRRPALKVLTLAGGGRHACLYELSLRRRQLGELTPGSILDVIRAAVDDDCQWVVSC